MFQSENEILYTIAILVILVILLAIHKKFVQKFINRKSINTNRTKLILNIGNFIFYVIAFLAIAIVWGVDFKQISVYLSSIIAVLGISFFAQWSVLSNLTSSVILFFYHPMRIGDRIRVLDKDFNWVGIVTDITGFYVHIKTDENENITLPNSLVIQKGIQLIEKNNE